jgi:16S rRNA (guanine527-N7)-methyltransferase
MTDDTRLLSVLAVVQTRGGIGQQSLVDAVAHADRFVDLIPSGPQTVIDLGSGGGLPALVVAWRRDDLIVTMVERRASRADLLRRAISSLDLRQRTSVINVDVEDVCGEAPNSFDVVTARSFADLATTIRFIDRLLGPGGVALISEPPVDRSDGWTGALAGYSSLQNEGVHQGIRRLRRRDQQCFT